MPEGPEVKIASDYFNEFFSETKNLEFEIISDYYDQKYFDVFNTVSKNLKKKNKTFTIGKNIFLRLKKNKIFNLHLGMTGGWTTEQIKHSHFRVFDNNGELFFKDVRKFGKMKIITLDELNNKFQPIFDLLNLSYSLDKHIRYLEEKINTKKSICSIIMNQNYFPGVGNYIKSESLYNSKIHPEEKWGNLNQKTRIRLIRSTQDVMIESYKSGGAELKDFKNPFNKSKFNLKIYGKQYTEKNNLVTSQKTSDSRKSWFCSKEQTLI